jgi:predicted transcriptional regulator
MNPHDKLSRRERQIMDIIYRLGSASVNDVLANLGDPPSYSAVRASMRILVEKGHLRHKQDGPRYIFMPTVPRKKAQLRALKGVLRNFFDNSSEQLVSTLLDDAGTKISEEELARLMKLIEKAKKEGR